MPATTDQPLFCLAYGGKCAIRQKCAAYVRFRTAPDRRLIPVIDDGKACIANKNDKFEKIE